MCFICLCNYIQNILDLLQLWASTLIFFPLLLTVWQLYLFCLYICLMGLLCHEIQQTINLHYHPSLSNHSCHILLLLWLQIEHTKQAESKEFLRGTEDLKNYSLETHNLLSNQNLQGIILNYQEMERIKLALWYETLNLII